MSESFTASLWDMAIYAEQLEEVDPYLQLHRFRPRDIGFQGSLDFWATPSPEPALSQSLVKQLSAPQASDGAVISAIQSLAHQFTMRNEPSEILFVAILRAGVPIAKWLTQLLPGSLAVATSLFVGYGIDRIALNAIRANYPQRRLKFVDGWTGKGGVARELDRLNAGPLAVLCDPWGLADYRGTTDDILSPSACFTGPMTLGFSRTFTRCSDQKFAAYQFPQSFLCKNIVDAWVKSCPSPLNHIQVESPIPEIQHTTPLRIHSNEVCRALINSQPEVVMFADSQRVARQCYSLLIELADTQNIPQQFNVNELQHLENRVCGW